MSVPTLFVRNLPASASNGRLEEIFAEIGPVKSCFVVKEKGTDKCRGFGYVTFSMEEDSQRALKEIKEYDGQKISVSVAKKKLDNTKKGAIKESAPKEQKSKDLKRSRRKARLIIRNLSFKCIEGDLNEIFSKYGTVLEVKIPLKPDGKMRGFAFVQFKNMLEAGRALSATNLKEIKGRQVAVDWAVAKDKYVATVNVPAGSIEGGDEAEDPEPESEEETELPSLSITGTAEKVDDESESGSAEGDGDEEEDEEEMAEEEKESSEGDSDDSDPGSDDDDDDKEDDDDDDDDGDDDEGPSEKKPPPSDVNEGRTVFIRNLSFDTEEEGIEKALLEFGEMKYIRIVLHPDTEHSRGCAFAQFKTKEAAEKCITAAQDSSENGGIQVDGRRLNIVLAVSRDDAVKLKEKATVKTQTGTRNLYLAREGLIRAGTKAAEGVPAADMAKRARFEDLKRMKLRDINVFVSKTRLCVHNLPKSVDVRQLRQLCAKAAGGGKGVRITECHVMYDRKPQGGKVIGRSLGYAFVQFQEHEHALATLRHLNNNPEIFGPNKRPIVEFSLEDSRKLKLKEMRAQQNKIRAKQNMVKQQNPPQQRGRQQNPPQQRGRQQNPPQQQGKWQNPPQQRGARQNPPQQRGAQQNPPQQRGKWQNPPQQRGAQQNPPQQRGKWQRGMQQNPPQQRGGQHNEQRGKWQNQQHRLHVSGGEVAAPSAVAPPKVGQVIAGTPKHYSGFNTTPVVEEVELEDGKKRRKVLAMPSHRGPKIRKRDKGKRPMGEPKKLKNRPKRNERASFSCMEKESQSRSQAKKKQREKDHDGFESLVEQYKKKLLGNATVFPARKSKWFSG